MGIFVKSIFPGGQAAELATLKEGELNKNKGRDGETWASSSSPSSPGVRPPRWPHSKKVSQNKGRDGETLYSMFLTSVEHSQPNFGFSDCIQYIYSVCTVL